MLQCDDQTLRSITETLVFHFDQEKFEQLLSRGSKSPLHVRKHREISIAKVPLATSKKQVSVETLRLPVNLTLPHARLDKLCASLSQSQLGLN